MTLSRKVLWGLGGALGTAIPSDEILPTRSLLTTRVVVPILRLEGVLYPFSRVPDTLTVETPFGSVGVEGTGLVPREGEGETALCVSEGQ